MHTLCGSAADNFHDLGLAAVGLTIPLVVMQLVALGLVGWLWRAARRVEAEEKVLAEKVADEED